MGGWNLERNAAQADGPRCPGESGSRLISAWLMAMALGGCDSVRNVLDKPVIEPPVAAIVLQGTISGLGSRRPLVLQLNGQDVCADTASQANNSPCRFFGIPGQTTSTFSFGSQPEGTVYEVTVKSQPFGKRCEVKHANGILGVSQTPPVVTCSNDPAVPRFPLTVQIAPAVAAIPSATVRLETEEGEQVLPVNGATTLNFPDALFDSKDNLPVFKWFVTASMKERGTTDNCHVRGGTNELRDSQGQDITRPPTGPVADVEVTLCSFTVEAAVDYQPADGKPALGMPEGGMQIALRRSRTGKDERVVTLDQFSTITFPDISSNDDAIFELAVIRPPQGMACLVGSSRQYQWGSAVLLLDPLDANRATNHGWITRRNVRCRTAPPPEARLKGSYRILAGPASGGTVLPTRNFLTFFPDGTYLYAHHALGVACSVGCGVEQGFYVFDEDGQRISFEPTTDTNGASGLSIVSIGAAIASPLTQVRRTLSSPSRIEASFGDQTWHLVEPDHVPGQMAGVWATADGRRVWIFDADSYNGLHVGVNGLGNVQDGCYNIPDVTAAAGSYTRRGNNTTCQLGPGYFTLDVPNAATVPRSPEGFVGKWPQSTSNADGRPSSPVNYLITPGSPDTLRIRETVNGSETVDGVTPVSPEIVLYRLVAD